MKKTILNLSLLITFTAILVISCKKKEVSTPEEKPVPAATTTGSPVAVASFTWTENGGSVNTADSAYWTTGSWGTGVRAFKGGYTNFFEINWATSNNTSVGTKAITSGSFTFLKGAATYTNTAAENLSVTEFASNALSGGFTLAVSGGTTTSIVGGFNVLSKK